MKRAGGGKIVNIASLLSFQGGITVPAYAASKGGVAQLTKALANEWAGRGVNVGGRRMIGYARRHPNRAPNFYYRCDSPARTGSMCPNRQGS